MNANHDPEAARSTCCFPVQIAYNFYCHGRNSSLMEARLISSVLVLRRSRVPCVLLPSPRNILPATPLPSASPLACRSARFLTLFPAFPRASSHLSLAISAIPISRLVLDPSRSTPPRALCRSYIRRIRWRITCSILLWYVAHM